MADGTDKQRGLIPSLLHGPLENQLRGFGSGNHKRRKPHEDKEGSNHLQRGLDEGRQAGNLRGGPPQRASRSNPPSKRYYMINNAPRTLARARSPAQPQYFSPASDQLWQLLFADSNPTPTLPHVSYHALPGWSLSAIVSRWLREAMDEVIG